MLTNAMCFSGCVFVLMYPIRIFFRILFQIRFFFGIVFSGIQRRILHSSVTFVLCLPIGIIVARQMSSPNWFQTFSDLLGMPLYNLNVIDFNVIIHCTTFFNKHIFQPFTILSTIVDPKEIFKEKTLQLPSFVFAVNFGRILFKHIFAFLLKISSPS